MFLGTIENDLLEETTVNPKSKMAAAAILDFNAYDKKTPKIFLQNEKKILTYNWNRSQLGKKKF